MEVFNMAKYFKHFPKVYYTPNSEMESLDVLTNITTRFSFEQDFKKNSSIYYEYSVEDGETPEIVAAKIYGSSEKHWIIMNLNDIVDPMYDWPLTQRNVIKYIDSKYSANASVGQTGYEWAVQTTHSYYRIETQTINLNEQVNVAKYQIDANTYATLASSTTSYTLADGNQISIAVTKEPKTYYEYEVDENENKRTIKILKPEIIPAIEKEFKRVLNDTIK
jgi:predicted secreted protein